MIDATPERSATRRSATAEASVTTRIRQRLQDISAPQPETTDTDVSPVATHPPTLSRSRLFSQRFSRRRRRVAARRNLRIGSAPRGTSGPPSHN